MSIHSCSLGAPILVEEATALGLQPAPKAGTATPSVDKMKAIRNEAWNPFFEVDPLWTDKFMATGGGIYASGVLPAKEVELLSIALDASFTHMYAPGTRRHIHNGLKSGATVEEVMEVLKLCVSQGVQVWNMSVSILVEELSARRSETNSQPHGNSFEAREQADVK
jgi:alkylhydroperoxidase/carboxymuconolactone decarboxylase family protein YurZ